MSPSGLILTRVPSSNVFAFQSLESIRKFSFSNDPAPSSRNSTEGMSQRIDPAASSWVLGTFAAFTTPST